MDNIQLNIKTKTSTITIQSTKEKLIKLTYFKSFFDIGEIPNTLDMDLTNFKYDNIDMQIKILFNFLNDNISIPTTIYDYHILLELCDYFGYEKLIIVMNRNINDYCNFMFLVSKPNSDTTLFRTYHKELVTNIHNLYTLFTKTKRMNNFIDVLTKCNYDYIKTKTLNFEHELNNYPLEQCFDIFKNMPSIYDNIPTTFKLYDHIDILNYEPCNKDVYYAPIQKPPQYHIPSLKPDFHNNFARETNNIFDGMDWSNIIIAGGFIFGLVNNVNNSIIDSTDIDMYIYGNDTNKTKNYLLQHLSQYNPYYLISKNIITVIIPSIKYDIQIIIMDNTTPFDIIGSFDLNYVELYYDGDAVYATIDCMYALKYQVAIFNVCKYNVNKRFAKTVLKGLRIAIDDELNKTDVIKKINDVYQYNPKFIEGMKSELFKENVRNVHGVLSYNEFCDTLKQVYGCKGVIRDYTTLTYAYMNKSNFSDYVKKDAIYSTFNNNYYPTLGDKIILHTF